MDDQLSVPRDARRSPTNRTRGKREQHLQSSRRQRFENGDGVEFVADGDTSRHELLREAANAVTALSDRATKLLFEFMKHTGVFELDGVYVPEHPDADGCALTLRFNFVADADPHEFGYTYFDVHFSPRDVGPERFWPVKFTVGFH